MRLHSLQHVPHEHPGFILDWARKRGHALNATRFYKGEDVPESTESLDFLVVMGGPMDTWQKAEYAWLEPEIRFIRAAVDRGLPVLGICLGSQLIAEALGAQVTKGEEPEIGWWPIQLTGAARGHSLTAGLDPGPTVFHWHSYTFTLPAGATHLASSPACANQAFAHGERVLALQFHPEVTPGLLHGMAEADGPHIDSTRPWCTPTGDFFGDDGRLTRANAWLETILDRLAVMR